MIIQSIQWISICKFPHSNAFFFLNLNYRGWWLCTHHVRVFPRCGAVPDTDIVIPILLEAESTIFHEQNTKLVR